MEKSKIYDGIRLFWSWFVDDLKKEGIETDEEVKTGSEELDGHRASVTEAEGIRKGAPTIQRLSQRIIFSQAESLPRTT